MIRMVSDVKSKTINDLIIFTLEFRIVKRLSNNLTSSVQFITWDFQIAWFFNHWKKHRCRYVFAYVLSHLKKYIYGISKNGVIRNTTCSNSCNRGFENGCLVENAINNTSIQKMCALLKILENLAIQQTP